MKRGNIGVLGIPWDEKSSFMRGCSDAPTKIWDAFNCDSANRFTENGCNLGRDEGIRFSETIELSRGNQAIEEIEAYASKLAMEGVFPLFIGGDHALSLIHI